MVVVNQNSSNQWEVDLCRTELGIISFRDVLVFLELATLTETADYPLVSI